MRPAKQGAFDALCGVYAIINAVELVGITGRKSSLHKVLFGELIRAIPPPRLRTGLISGLEAADLIAASRQAFRWLRRTHGVDLRVGLPFSDREFEQTGAYVEAVRSQCLNRQRAVIIGIQMPGGSHWTVARMIEGQRVYLRDSGRLTYLDLRRYGVAQSRYKFITEDTLIIRRRT